MSGDAPDITTASFQELVDEIQRRSHCSLVIARLKAAKPKEADVHSHTQAEAAQEYMLLGMVTLTHADLINKVREQVSRSSIQRGGGGGGGNWEAAP